MADEPGADAALEAEMERLVALLCRVEQVAILASHDYSAAAALLKHALVGRGCHVIAGLEAEVHAIATVRPIADPISSTLDSSGSQTCSRVVPSLADVVLVFGSQPSKPELFGKGGALQAAMTTIMQAVAEKVLLVAIGCGGPQGKGGSFASLVQASPSSVERLASLVATVAQEEPSQAASRWDETVAAATCGLQTAEDLHSCLACWPELRSKRCSQGRTLLHKAACAGAYAAAELLFSLGISLDAQDMGGHTAGDVAFLAGQQDVFDFLVARASEAARQIGRSGRGPDGQPSCKRSRKSVTDLIGLFAGEEHAAYLQERLCYEDGRLVDADGCGVMMGWEAPLMFQHARLLLPNPGADCLNIGFGLGLVDGFLQERGPRSHAVIEAHPDVLAELRRRGWPSKAGVTIHEGCWQDVIATLPDSSLDAIFFDTWKETYDDMLPFFAEVPRLLRPGGRLSFFNGLAPYSIFKHAVMCRMAQEDLACLGLICDFMPVRLGELADDVWRGIAEKYWQFETYYLPVATLGEATRPSDASGKLPPPWRLWPSAAVRVGDQVGLCAGPKFFEPPVS